MMLQSKVKANRGNEAAILNCASLKFLSGHNLSFIYATEETGCENAEVFFSQTDFIEVSRDEQEKRYPSLYTQTSRLRTLIRKLMILVQKHHNILYHGSYGYVCPRCIITVVTMPSLH